MRRTMDASYLNLVANQPDVRPLLGGEGPIDLQDILNNPHNYGFVNDYGGFVVTRLCQGRYECHTIFRPGEGGRDAIRLMRAAQAYMFTATPCDEIVTKVSKDNEPAYKLAIIGGFQVISESEGMSYQNLTLDRWVRTCSTLAEQGHAFHDQLEAAKVAKGSKLPIHPDDETHDRYVGAAFEMVKAGNAAKGVDTYNRWALFAGFAPAALLTLNPVVIDIQDAVVSLRDGSMEVLKCR